ncbi:MAG: DUF695 domain-containing protein [Prevotella sp.]|nr:DUF695 domain-containing protein [Prevotella sp.]
MKTKEERKVNVWFPDESFITINYTCDGHPAFAVINESLRQFEFKDVFGWNLSIVFELADVCENGLPGRDEVKVIQDFCEHLGKLFNDDREKPNALFLFREHYDGISHAVWRVYDAKKVEAVLRKIIGDKQHPREFDYEMEYDEDWNLVEWYLQDFHKE